MLFQGLCLSLRVSLPVASAMYLASLFLFILCFSWLPCYYSWISLDGLFCVQCFVITLCSLWCILFVHTLHCVYMCQIFELLTRQRTFSSSGRQWHHSGPSFALGGFGKHSAPNTVIGGLLPQWWYLGLILFSFFVINSLFLKYGWYTTGARRQLRPGRGRFHPKPLCHDGIHPASHSQPG